MIVAANWWKRIQLHPSQRRIIPPVKQEGSPKLEMFGKATI
jgi:hypothetical protein